MYRHLSPPCGNLRHPTQSVATTATTRKEPDHLTPLSEAFTKLVDSLRELARAFMDAIRPLLKPYLDAANRYLVRRHHVKRRKAARKVTPATYIPVRRHPHRKQSR